jgi:RNA polymerase sigma-70 factor (ECF subfamily)
MDGPQAVPLGRDARRVTDATDPLAARIDARVDLAYRLAAVILGDALEAEDAVADAALSAWRSRSDLRDLDRFDAWFDRIVVNGCRDRLRARRRRPVEVIPVELADSSTDDDFRTLVDTRDTVGRAMDALEPDERIVLVLRFWADLPVDSIAARLNVPAGTVKSRLNRATGRMRTLLLVAEGDR